MRANGQRADTLTAAWKAFADCLPPGVSQRIVRLGAAGYGMPVSGSRAAALAAAIIAADVDRVSLSGPGEALILLGIAKRRAAEMAMNLDRLLLWLVSTKTILAGVPRAAVRKYW